MGAVGSDFEARAFEIVGRHVPSLDRSLVESRASREGRYVSYTFRFTATSRGQLEELYADLNQCEQVKAVL
jgi:putative lipoic acid-binding regulatory protein